jgi:hypothetical protein
VTFVTPMLNERSIVNLLAAAGITAGVGDWRAEKGKGAYGQFRLANPDDPELPALLAQGRKVQIAAMADHVCYDGETRELLSWYEIETNRRGIKVAS